VVEAFRAADMPEGVRLGLLPLTERRRQRARALLSVRRLAVIASLTWLAGAGVFLVRLREARAEADREIARLLTPIIISLTPVEIRGFRSWAR